MTECIQARFEFPELGRLKVEADFGGGHLSSDGGALLLRQLDLGERLLAGLEECFVDRRDMRWVEHPLGQLLRQRIFGLALGYEDVNDHDTLRHDPLLSVICEQDDVLGQRRMGDNKGKALAGKSTLNRLELGGTVAASRYHKIEADEDKLRSFLLERGVKAIPRKSGVIVIDFDATDSIIHGHQQGRFFYGYYGNYCYLPLYAFCGDIPLWAQLRTSNRDASDGTLEALQQIVAAIRERFGKKVAIIVRADSGFCRDALLAWCESQRRVYYCIGLARNERLQEMVAAEFDQLRQDRADLLLCAQAIGADSALELPNRAFAELKYSTLKSWTRQRRVVAKIEITREEENPRFIVTNIPAKELLRKVEGAEVFVDGAALYERFYCARGEMENRIKEQQMDLFADRTSTHCMRSNQLRLWFSTLAYFLLERLRSIGLAGTDLANATVGTLRLKLFKVAAQVRVSVRRIHVALCSACPVQGIWQQVYANLRLNYG